MCVCTHGKKLSSVEVIDKQKGYAETQTIQFLYHIYTVSSYVDIVECVCTCNLRVCLQYCTCSQMCTRYAHQDKHTTPSPGPTQLFKRCHPRCRLFKLYRVATLFQHTIDRVGGTHGNGFTTVAHHFNIHRCATFPGQIRHGTKSF